MKIGILTFHWATNYGAVLQCYALQQFLEKKGHHVEIINYKPEKFDFSWKRYFRHPFSVRYIKRDYIQNKKESLLTVFRNTYLNLTKRYFLYRELEEISSEYDVVISGSDQVLNPSFTISGEGCPTPTYYLKFVKDDILKIGYAVSFGCTNYPNVAYEKAKSWITSFDKIGVRENTGKDILASFDFQKEVKVVPDPTILQGRDLFDKITVVKPKVKDYLCVYILRRNIKVEAKTNIVYIDETNHPVSMEEWLGYISYSNGLITNSYHGMIMAILFHIPFVVLLEKGGSVGMNDRFTTLLMRLELIDRIASTEEMMDVILANKINWDYVDSKMSEYKNIGESFLDL